MDPLEGCKLKIERAGEHLHSLDAEVRGYIKRSPYAVMVDYNPEGNRPRAFVVEPPPRQLSVIVGDYIHNLRSALDHLACQCVISGGGTVTNRTQFPIFENAGVYQDRVHHRRAGLEGASVACVAYVESLQPYHRGNRASGHPLAIIGTLSNLDKHRQLAIAAQWVPYLDKATLRPHPLPDPGKETGSVYFFREALMPSDDVQMHVQQSLFVLLQEPPGLPRWPIVDLLDESLKFVRDSVVPGLTPFLS